MPPIQAVTFAATQPRRVVTDGRLLRGQKSRRAVLEHAVQLASSVGLEGLSIASVAKQVGVPKSSVFALFGSKQQLQLATVAAGREIFIEQVIEPALHGATAIEQLYDLGDSWFDYLGSEVFSGGCFLVAVAGEMDARPGPVRDSIAAALTEWIDLLTALVNAAVGEASLVVPGETADLVFRLNAFGMAANFHCQLLADSAAVERAHGAWRTELENNQPSEGAKQCPSPIS